MLPSTLIHFVPAKNRPHLDFTSPNASESPFTPFLQHLTTILSTTPASTIHRIVVPSLLSPAYYPVHASKPEHVLQFLHGLRALLRKNPLRLTAVISLPLTLHARASGLTRWMEILSDGALEIAPFPSTNLAIKAASGSTSAQEEPPQGMLKIHRLPVFHEKGGGGGEASGFRDDLAFTLSRRKGLIIKPYSLPPVEEDLQSQHTGKENSKADIEF